MAAVWRVVEQGAASAPLRGRCEVDVAVIGGGITGATLALQLAEAGRRVALLEAHRIGGGSTGGSTGNLYATVSLKLGTIRRKWDEEVVREVVAARAAAVNFIEQSADRFAIDCQFRRCPLHFALTAADASQEEQLVFEHETSRLAGLDAAMVSAIPGMPVLHRALRIEAQAQFNPLAYTTGLARAAAAAGALLFEQSSVRDISASGGAGGRGVVTTDAGEVHAQQIVAATHTPKGINLLQAEMEPYLEHGIAAVAPPGLLEPGVHWLLDDSCSLRPYQFGDQHWLVAVGSKHKTGENLPDDQPLAQLRALLRQRFGLTEFSHAWSAQQFHPADELPYIGPSGHDNIFVATGFAADGLTWGTVAAQLIADQIFGRPNRWAERFAARRFTPTRSAGNWLKENAAVARHMVADRLGIETVARLQELPVGSGRIVEVDGEKVAAYHAPDGRVTAVSPVCPHMKCYVQWNPTDTTWDCPCHGSRFQPDGTVIEGPALAPLAPMRLERSS